jgi:hypothetical protein
MLGLCIGLLALLALGGCGDDHPPGDAAACRRGESSSCSNGARQ